MKQAREMTLGEYIAQIPINHRARQEFYTMRDQHTIFSRNVQEFAALAKRSHELGLGRIADALESAAAVRNERDELKQQCAESDLDISGLRCYLNDAIAERDRLREALEILTATCERNHRVIAMGSTHDKYQFSYSCAAVHNPVKRARAALKEAGE